MAFNDYKIINQLSNTYLSKDEYYLLYNFFVTYSLCENLSLSKRKLQAYGFNNIKRVERTLKELINFDSPYVYILDKDSVTNIDLCNNYLNDYNLTDLSFERATFIELKKETNKYFQLFHHIRNSLAHGSFAVVEENNEKYLIMQSNEGISIKSRMIFKLSTIIKIIEVIDQNQLIINRE